MSQTANPLRGETAIEVAEVKRILRPSFENLVAAEEELGSLFALVERASNGALTITEITVLLWHCLPQQGRPSRDELGATVLQLGLIEATKPVRAVLSQVLQGRV
ncbi:MAG: gene transfer agent family protein [Pseudomonadota bacterium]